MQLAAILVSAANQVRLKCQKSLGVIERRESKETGHVEWIHLLHPAPMCIVSLMFTDEG